MYTEYVKSGVSHSKELSHSLYKLTYFSPNSVSHWKNLPVSVLAR